MLLGKTISAVVCVAAVNSALAAPAVIVRTSQLKNKPLLDAAVIAEVTEGATVDLISNQGGWSKIKTSQGKTGYVRLLNVRPRGGNASNALASLDKLGNVARTGSTGEVATTGVKGITKDDIAKSTPNHNEVLLMEQYSSSAVDARKFAQSAKIAEKSVAYLNDKKLEEKK